MDLLDSLRRAVGASYSLERELEGGGMSRVFLATETALGRTVVIKVLPPELSGAVSVERFRREIRVAAQLQHPHIVPVLAAGDAGGVMYYTMPFVQGESLRTTLARSRDLPVAGAVRVLRDVAAAMAYAHKRGVVHRDIKPDNILLSDGYALVTDFGVARALTSSSGGHPDRDGLTSLGIALGTPAYMAPEQAAADPAVDHRADIYAVGVLAYELLCGTTPFAGRPPAAQLAAQVSEVPESIASRRPGIPAALAELVDGCLRKSPAERPQSADELVAALDEIATAPSEAVAMPPRAPRAFRRWLLAAAVVAAAVATTLAMIRTDPPVDKWIIAVFPFRVSAGDPSLSYLREGMQDLLAIKLSNDAGMRTSDVRAVLSALRREGSEDVPPQRLADITRELGAGQMLRGEIVGTPEGLVIRATLTALGGADVHATVQGPADSVSHLVDVLAAQLLSRQAGESERLLANLSATPLTALREHLAGQAHYRRGAYGRAADSYRRALEIDSSFAPAAMGAAAAMSWITTGAPRDSLRAVAWRMRDQLSGIDRLRMEAEFGVRTPGFTPATERIAAAERFVAAAPDNIDAWYLLGDSYWHHGAEIGLADFATLALSAFERALVIDSTYWPAAEHLPGIRHALGDTAGRRRAAEHLRSLDSLNARGGTAAWIQATASAAERGQPLRANSAADAGAAIGLAFQAVVDHNLHPDAARVLHDEWIAMMASPMPEDRRRDRSRYSRHFESLFGHPRHAAQSDSIAIRAGGMWSLAIPNALFADGDTISAARAAQATRRMLRDTVADRPLDERVFALATLSLWTLERGPDDELQPLLRQLRAIASLDDTVHAAAPARLMTLAIDAVLADRAGSPDTLAALARLDSLARMGAAPALYAAAANLIAARLWEGHGRLDLALAATRRRQYGLALYPFTATLLREQGRLAESAGDLEGAIRAYRHYLTLRFDPEPPLREEARQIAERLARLERASAGR